MAKSVLDHGHYLDWDIQEDRLAIIQGQRHLAAQLGSKPNQTILFDELFLFLENRAHLRGFHTTLDYSSSATFVLLHPSSMDKKYFQISCERT